MNFFQNLFEQFPGIDLQMTIKEKNGNFSVSVLPSIGNKIQIQPLVVTGTPIELDAEFINIITPAIQEIKPELINMNEVKESIAAEKKAIEDSKPKPKKTDDKKSDSKVVPKKVETKKSKVKTPAPQAIDMFASQDAGNTSNSDDLDDNDDLDDDDQSNEE